MKKKIKIGNLLIGLNLAAMAISLLMMIITRFEDLSKYYAWGYCFLANLIMFAILLVIKESK
ncbi:MAG: hypothetical protein PUJ51_16475 [Clostridiales bacterium]|uniref:hypothetical protein n=1 Tax=Terrisporobacter sp. TaxID=1965305 RepID=UPI002A58F274|nr:hypothetical protein [Terrisporobacter sp.]MDD7756084.1 hypothetical protein [Clostridiales bacterium]MDY4135285.1 hypothetical protein [Terrisporobacter sp.]